MIVFCVFTCIVRQRFNKSSGNYNYHTNRFTTSTYWNSSTHYTPQWHRAKEPRDNWNTSYNKYKSKGANRQRQSSSEPTAKRQAVSSSAPRHTAADSAAPVDTLTNKLTERTSTIINNVLSGKGNSDSQNCSVSSDRVLTNVPNVSYASTGSQSKHHERLPSSNDKPKNTGRISDNASRPKQSTSSTSGHVNTVAASRVQPNKSPVPARSDVLLSPNRTGVDTQASLVRMATAPRSRREQLELEKMMHEHAKKLAATKDHVQFSAMNACTNNVPNVLQQSPVYSHLTEGTSSSTADNTIVIGDESGNTSAASVQNGTSSSAAAKSVPRSSAGPSKSAKKTRVNNSKAKTARMLGTKVLGVKTANSKVTRKRQTEKRNRFGKQVPKKSLSWNATGTRPSQSQIPSMSNLDLGSLGLPPNLLRGLTSNQQSNTASRSTSSIPAASASEQGPMNTLLQMSLHEEVIYSKLSQCSGEIDQLRIAITKLDEELQKRIQLKAMVSSVWIRAVNSLLMC